MISIGLGGSDGSCRSCPGAREGQIRGVHTPRDGPICGSGSRVMRRIMLLVILALVCFLGPGQRIGEAGNPGPGTGLDNSQVSAWVEWTDDETHRDPWSNGPPLDDLSGGAVAGGVMLAPPFVAARKFSGHQPGAVFKMGEHGLGYYRDMPPVVELFPLLRPLHAIPPVVLRLDALVCTGPDSPCSGAALASADAPAVAGGWRRCRRACRGKRRGPKSCQPTLQPLGGTRPAAAARGLESDDEHAEGDAGWLDDDSLQAADRSHVAAGLWAVDTINPNAWPGTMEYLRISAADFVATQECRVRQLHCGDKEASARSDKWSMSVAPCVVTAAGSTSAGVAVGARSHIGVALPAAGDDNICPTSPLAGRFRLRRIGAVCRGGFHLGSVYLHDTVGVAATCNLDLLQAIAAELSLVSGGWILGGDWNCTPAELSATGWLDLIEGTIHAPLAATCNGKVYDYFVVQRRFSFAVHSVHTIGDAECRPHSPARLLLRAAPRCILVRGLRRPRGFRARLPFGPAQEPSEDGPGDQIAAGPMSCETGEMDIEAEYSTLMTSIEAALSDVAGHDAKLAAAHAGRANGVSFRWRNACGAIATSCPRSTAISRAWRRVANWLGDISRVGVCSPAAAAAARRRVLHYDHGLPQSSEAASFETWLSLLHHDMLLCQSWVDSLHETAKVAAAQAEAESVKVARMAWRSWLTEGPAKGLRRQHRMSRTSVGWMPAPVAVPDEVSLSEADLLDELDECQLVALRRTVSEAQPMTVQQLADKEATIWAAEWGVGREVQEVTWPADLGPPPPLMTLCSLKRALASFAEATGLGWDDLHPRALLRLSDSLLLALLRLLAACERYGRWPRGVAVVIIALLPKPDGGRRPIGLFPLLPRVWMRVRRDVAREWERLHERPYLYAGVGKGANVAAWKQAARAELALAIPGVEYGQALLDLVKAFDRVPHHILAREAAHLGYSLWVLRLALAAYRLGRVLRLDGAISSLVFALRGITAGSGLATTEMRILLMRIVDEACVLYPAVTPTLFVDDLSAEVAGTRRFILRYLIPFVLFVCDRMTNDHLEISRKKSVCVASSDSLGKDLARGLQRFGIRCVRRVKSLGSGLGAGARRNAQVTMARLRAFRRRLPSFKRLRASGVSTSRLLRTGGIAAMTYGQAVVGVAPSTLLQQRRSAAAAAAPAVGICGQSLDLALIVADETGGGKADPAFAAHGGPIGEWAQAVWEHWLPIAALMRLTRSAKQRLARAKRPWSVVRGPAAAAVASAERLGWVVHDARRFTTDAGNDLDLAIDPPIVVARECEAAVRRWRWRAVATAFPALEPSGGAHFAPVLALMQPASESRVWTADLRAALRSAVLGRQWPQSRCFAAGYASHNKCCLCLAAALRQHGASCIDDLPPEIVDGIPIGNLVHRVWSCPRHREARALYAPDDVRFRQPTPAAVTACTRALVPSVDQIVPAPASEATFSWIVRPENGTVRARFYTDGSRLDGPSALLARNGWAFVAIDARGEVVASASGVPPSWIVDIPGTEAWALLQAASVAELGSDFRLDCKPCVDAIERGRAWATAAARPLARVFGLVFWAIDDTSPESFVWMPAHCGHDDVGRARLGDGSLLSETDRWANDQADRCAKDAVKAHRVPADVRKRVKDASRHVRDIAMWLGRVTHLANNQPETPRRDSDASRQAAAARSALPGCKRRSPPGGRTKATPCLTLLRCLEPLRDRVVARAASRAQAASAGSS